MRIWDIHPGYLNCQNLLGEHRALHWIVSRMAKATKGDAQHPETLRWLGHGWALRMRHQLLAAEMSLRNLTDRTPVDLCTNEGAWPTEYREEPGRQFKILEDTFTNKAQGRIPLPKHAQQLWSQHKYSVLARDVNLYKQIGRQVSAMPANQDFSALAKMLAELLRMPPKMGGIKNSLQHMWGYVSHYYPSKQYVETWSLYELFAETQRCVLASQEPYLMASTAMSELKVWIHSS